LRAVITSSGRSIQYALHIASIAFIAVVAGVLLILQPFPVLHDYPEWMYQGYIAYSLLTDGTPFSGLYQFVHVPVPNAISQSVIAALNVFTSPVAAGKIWLAFYFILASVIGIIATRSHRYGGSLQLIFTLSIVLGPGFWNGYINFQFGLLFFALYLIWAQRGAGFVLVFSLLIYFSHASVFAGFVCYVFASEVFTRRRLSVFLALSPSLILLLWYTATKLSADGGLNESVGSLVQWAQYKLYTLAKQGPFHNFIQTDGESLLATVHGLYLTGFAINFLVALLIGVWLLITVVSVVRRQDTVWRADLLKAASVPAVVITLIVLLVAWLLAGKNNFGVVNLGERFLVVALMLLILHVQCPDWVRRTWAALCVVIGIVTLGSLLILSRETGIYTVDRSADSAELENYVGDIYSNSRHKYFNHRLFIYANLGQYLTDPQDFASPPPIDHQSSIVRVVPTSK